VAGTPLIERGPGSEVTLYTDRLPEPFPDATTQAAVRSALETAGTVLGYRGSHGIPWTLTPGPDAMESDVWLAVGWAARELGVLPPRPTEEEAIASFNERLEAAGLPAMPKRENYLSLS